MIRYDPTLVELTSNFFDLRTNVKVHLYNYSQWVELSMNFHVGKGTTKFQIKTRLHSLYFGLLLSAYQRRCDITSHRRRYDVVLTSHACWVKIHVRARKVSLVIISIKE